MVKRKIAQVEAPESPDASSPSSKKARGSVARERVVAADFEPVDPAVLPDNARLDLADSEIYYVPDFVDKKTAKRWYDELVELDSCTSAHASLYSFAAC